MNSTPSIRKKIRILTEDLKVEAELNESETAGRLWGALPIQAKANRWGEEIYFTIPVESRLEKGSRETVAAGELGYWPPGRAFCIFFGPTPASQGDEIRAASAVNIIGKVVGDATLFKGVASGTRVKLERA